ncbi:hypothetical protein SNEBB_000846 [Seison nebaliae]|nr:hypothetical protein SNEBB_000846 [Seison nebaliae]
MGEKHKSDSKSECVQVVVRCRPMSEKEIADRHENIVMVDSRENSIVIKQSDSQKKTFTFDHAYDGNSTQKQLYDDCFSSIVDSVLEGYNGTIFAYGQTGTGKTYTMEGVRHIPEERGVIPHSFAHIFNTIKENGKQMFIVRASYLEIYKEDIRDLLDNTGKQKLSIRDRPDTGPYIPNLRTSMARTPEEIESVMAIGNKNRSVGRTDMNKHSSRSHAIFTIQIERKDDESESHIRAGKLHLVDLAGSERLAKTGAKGERLEEAKKINLSLLALGNVVSSLVKSGAYIPYRDSLLTRLLQDSLGGNAKTVMVATVGPANYNMEETLVTLNYANRAKMIKNRPKINEDPKDALLREYIEQINELREQLHRTKGGVVGAKEIHAIQSRSKKKKKKTKKRNDGNHGTGDASAGDENESDENIVDSKQLEEELKRQDQMREAARHELECCLEEKELLLGKLNERESEYKTQNAETKRLEEEIREMKKELRTMPKKDELEKRMAEQEKELEEKYTILEKEAQIEQEIQERLRTTDQTKESLEKDFSSKSQELETITKKLKKIEKNLSIIKSQVEEENERWHNDREELEMCVTDVLKKLSLFENIVNNFIPADSEKLTVERMTYDEVEEKWMLQPYEKKSDMEMGKRPRCDKTGDYLLKEATKENYKDSARLKLIGMQNTSLQHREGNFIILPLDLPNRTTRDYVEPTLPPAFQAELKSALRDESDIDIGTPKVSNASHKTKKNTARYPSAKGIIKRNR